MSRTKSLALTLALTGQRWSAADDWEPDHRWHPAQGRPSDDLWTTRVLEIPAPPLTIDMAQLADEYDPAVAIVYGYHLGMLGR